MEAKTAESGDVEPMAERCGLLRAVTCAQGAGSRKVSHANPYCLCQHHLGNWNKTKSKLDKGKEKNTMERREEGVPAGLTNMGQSCYVNPCVQLFYHDARIRDAVYNYKFTDDERHERIENVVRALQRLFAEMRHTPWDAADTTHFVRLLQLNDEQQDMQEFFQLFSQLCDELLAPCQDGKHLKRLLSDQFESRIRSDRRCTKCNHVVSKEETIRDLLLPLKPDTGELWVEEMIKNYLFEGEQLEVRCPKCDGNNAEIKQHFIRAAETMYIRFTRESFCPTSGSLVKDSRAVCYQNALDMTPFIDGEHVPKLAKERRYDLVAVFCHTGDYDDGHYYAIMKDPNAKWWHYDDDNVRVTKPPAMKRDAPGGAEADGDMVASPQPDGASAKKRSSKKTGGSAKKPPAGAGAKKPPVGTAYTECYMLAYRLQSARHPDVPCPQFLLDTVVAELEQQFEDSVVRKNQDLADLVDLCEERAALLNDISHAMQVEKDEGLPDMTKVSVVPVCALQEADKIECALLEERLTALTAEKTDEKTDEGFEAKRMKLEADNLDEDAPAAAAGDMGEAHAAEAAKSVGDVLAQKTGAQVLCEHAKVRPSDLNGGRWRVVDADGLARFVDFYRLKVRHGGDPPTLISLLCDECGTVPARPPVSATLKLADIAKMAKQLRRYSKPSQLPSGEEHTYAYVGVETIKQYLDVLRADCRKGAKEQKGGRDDATMVPFFSSVDHVAGVKEPVARQLDGQNQDDECEMGKIICAHGGLALDAPKCYLVKLDHFDRISETLKFDENLKLCANVTEQCDVCTDLKLKSEQDQEECESLKDNFTYTNAVINAALVDEKPTPENGLAGICDSPTPPAAAAAKTRKRKAADTATLVQSEGVPVQEIVRLENMSSECTVDSVKAKLRERTGVAPADMNVYWKRGALLERNDVTLGQAGIPAGATLVVELNKVTASARKQVKEEKNKDDKKRSKEPKKSFTSTGLALR